MIGSHGHDLNVSRRASLVGIALPNFLQTAAVLRLLLLHLHRGHYSGPDAGFHNQVSHLSLRDVIIKRVASEAENRRCGNQPSGNDHAGLISIRRFRVA